MATHDYVINDQTTPAFRSDLNNALGAIVSNNSSATQPSTTYGGMFWFDTSTNQLKMRDGSDANWIIVGELDVANYRWELISNSLTAASAAGIDVYNSAGTKIIDLQVASEATAKAGTNNTELMTPLRVAQAAGVPTGSVMPYAGISAPSNWLFCYGQGLSTTTYASLFSAIGYTYGGSGSSFNVPDLRGRVVAGQDDMGGSSANRLTGASGGVNGDVLGAAGGDEGHQLTEAELAAHTHGAGSYSAAAPRYEEFEPTAPTFSTTNFDAGNILNLSVSGTSGSTGSGSEHNNVQPTMILNYIIKI